MVFKVEKVDEVYNRIVCDNGTAYELNDYFTFTVPGAKHMPAVRNKIWDGKIRLFSPVTHLLYGGLNHHIDAFAKSYGYTPEYDSEFNSTDFSLYEANQFIDGLNLPSFIERRDFQVDAFTHVVRNRRALLLSPTASGKSLIIYLLMRYFKRKTLIIVPTITLVHQLAGDFMDYGFDVDTYVHKVHQGEEKTTHKPVTITTWQSVYKMPKSYFDKFRVVIGDEAHTFQATSLKSIMTKLTSCPVRVGLTGTLDGTKTHQLMLEGLFGPVKRVVRTVDLINQGVLSAFSIKAIELKYSDKTRKQCSKFKYQEEIDWIVRNSDRNRFIANLSVSLKGNTLVLFQFVDKHGKILYDMIRQKAGNRPVYFVSGEVDGEDRDTIRRAIETHDDAIIVASSVFTTGINIKKLHNIIFTSPSKARIKSLQSIGRVLRKSADKMRATLFDIADDLSHGTHRNYTLDHFVERLNIYNSEEFIYKIYPVVLKEE